MPIGVIGAGSTASYRDFSARKGKAVTIIAKEIGNITSYNSAGFFFPRPRKCSTPGEKSVFTLRGTESLRTYQEIIRGEHPFIKSGVRAVPAYFGLDIDPGFGPYSKEGLMEQPEKVIIDFQNGKSYPVMQYKTIFIHAVEMMQDLYRVARELNIRIEQTEIGTFDEVSQPIIFNCSGLGADSSLEIEQLFPYKAIW